MPVPKRHDIDHRLPAAAAGDLAHDRLFQLVDIQPSRLDRDIRETHDLIEQRALTRTHRMNGTQLLIATILEVFDFVEKCDLGILSIVQQ